MYSYGSSDGHVGHAGRGSPDGRGDQNQSLWHVEILFSHKKWFYHSGTRPMGASAAKGGGEGLEEVGGGG